jgi:hypothetical protein
MSKKYPSPRKIQNQKRARDRLVLALKKELAESSPNDDKLVKLVEQIQVLNSKIGDITPQLTVVEA